MVERGMSAPGLWCACECKLIYRLVGKAPWCLYQKGVSWMEKSPLPRTRAISSLYMPREGTEYSRVSVREREPSAAPVTMGSSGPIVATLFLRGQVRLVAWSMERRTWDCPCCGMARPYPTVYVIIGHDGVRSTVHHVRACLVICRPTPPVSLRAAWVVVDLSSSQAHSPYPVNGRARRSLLPSVGRGGAPTRGQIARLGVITLPPNGLLNR
jgi:hypothetical protein